MQYAVQCRRDQETITLPSYVAMWVIRQARDAGVESLLDLPEDQWAARAVSKTGTYRAFLLFARNAVEAQGS